MFKAIITINYSVLYECAIWLWNMVSYSKGGRQAKGIWSRPGCSRRNVLASRSRVRVFKPGWGRWIFSGRKNREHKSSESQILGSLKNLKPEKIGLWEKLIQHIHVLIRKFGGAQYVFKKLLCIGEQWPPHQNKYKNTNTNIPKFSYFPELLSSLASVLFSLWRSRRMLIFIKSYKKGTQSFIKNPVDITRIQTYECFKT